MTFNTIPGINMTVTMDGQPVSVDDQDGYVGRIEVLSDGAKQLRTSVKKMIVTFETAENRFVAASVDGKKNVTVRNNLSEDPSAGSKWQITADVKISDTGKPCAHTEYPQNSLRLVEMQQGGKVTIWEVSMISQGGNFFLAITNFCVGVYYVKSTNDLVVLGFSKQWPQMESFLKGAVIGAAATGVYDLKQIPHRSAFKPRPDNGLNAKDLVGNQARVVWFSVTTGIGMVMFNDNGRDAMARVHWNNIIVAKDQRLANLTPGQIVSAQRLGNPHTNTSRSTSFQWEAYGVRVLSAEEQALETQAAKGQKLPIWSEDQFRRMEALRDKLPPSRR